MIFSHSLIAVGILFIYDLIECKIKQDKEIQRENREKQKIKFIKLCLTGGPCGGKSSGINCIYNTFSRIAAPFLIVPQAATIIGSAGLTLDLSNFTPQQIQNFQIYLMRLQYNLQSNIESLALTLSELGRPAVILCDRGLLDGKAYAGDQNWDRMLKRIGVFFIYQYMNKLFQITQSQINNRYQAIFHMQTAARGAQQYYKYIPSDQDLTGQEQIQIDVNKVRRQTPQSAIQLDEKIQNCYIDHPNRFIIKNYFFIKDFTMKTIVLVTQVNQWLEYILRRKNIQNYFLQINYPQNGRKMSAEDFDINISPYLIRKRKYKKWTRERNQKTRERSPSPPPIFKIQTKNP